MEDTILVWRMPRHFSRLKKFRSLVVPGGGCRKGGIIQGGQLPSGLPVIGQSCMRRKGGVTGASIHSPRQSNSMYVQTVRWSIYSTRQIEHPHSPILQYEKRMQGPPSWPQYRSQNCSKMALAP